jgi:hypothetical protein
MLRASYDDDAKGSSLASIISAALVYPPSIPSKKCKCESGLPEGTRQVMSA